MKAKNLFTLAALFAVVAGASAQEAVEVDTRAQSAKTRAEVIAETRVALANGELKFGPLVEFEALLAPASTSETALAQRRRQIDLAANKPAPRK